MRQQRWFQIAVLAVGIFCSLLILADVVAQPRRDRVQRLGDVILERHASSFGTSGYATVMAWNSSPSARRTVVCAPSTVAVQPGK